ncbi:MAG TPA: hypothetical protein VGC84_17260 [Ilumatobacteraceae bacterium]
MTGVVVVGAIVVTGAAIDVVVAATLVGIRVTGVVDAALPPLPQLANPSAAMPNTIERFIGCTHCLHSAFGTLPASTAL